MDENQEIERLLKLQLAAINRLHEDMSDLKEILRQVKERLPVTSVSVDDISGMYGVD